MGIADIGFMTAFAAGLVSFLSPCVLPLVPGYLSYVAGSSAEVTPSGTIALRWPAVGLSVCFVLGFSTVFVILGASATALGQLLLSYRHEFEIVGGSVVIVFGLFMLGWARLPWLQREIRMHPAIAGGRPVSAYVLGLAFAFGWTPCIGPVLGAVLTVSAASATVAGGVSLLAIYSLGLGVPFVLAALFTDGLVARLKAIGRLGRVLQILAGGLLVLMGIAMITGQLTAIAYWLLEAFPVLADIG
ncbi:MAG: cytochrome c biogenesis protein CcdA [Rhodospirillales bacterium]|nr:cytochrome c biogenesis protein CcdA [Rhodospirillales bacterium]